MKPFKLTEIEKAFLDRIENTVKHSIKIGDNTLMNYKDMVQLNYLHFLTGNYERAAYFMELPYGVPVLNTSWRDTFILKYISQIRAGTI